MPPDWAQSGTNINKAQASNQHIAMPVRLLQETAATTDNRDGNNSKNGKPKMSVPRKLNPDLATPNTQGDNDPAPITDNATVPVDYTENPCGGKDSSRCEDARCVPALQLFASQPQCVGGANKTSFATEPTEITPRNAAVFFQSDHTPIGFNKGYRHGDNFEAAWAIPGDIDNSHSEDPTDWLTAEWVSGQLRERGINHWWHSSRNDNLSKEGAVRREKFHVVFPLPTFGYSGSPVSPTSPKASP